MSWSYANPFRRLIAYWIDITLLYACVFGLQFGFAALTHWKVANWLAASRNGFLIWGWVFLTASVPMWLYFILNERSPHQATPGKLLLGLKVTDLNGQRIPMAVAVWRTVIKLAFFEIGHLSFFFPTPLFEEANPPFRFGFVLLIALMGLYFALTLITPRHQSLHDLLVKTLVVRWPKMPAEQPEPAL